MSDLPRALVAAVAMMLVVSLACGGGHRVRPDIDVAVEPETDEEYADADEAIEEAFAADAVPTGEYDPGSQTDTAQPPEETGETDAESGSDGETLPPPTVRVLLLGSGTPANPDIDAIAAHLAGLLSADPDLVAPEATALPIEASAAAGPISYGVSLMNFFYMPDGRDERLAPLAWSRTHVVLFENPAIAAGYPELHFEGVRAVGDLARAAGATPVELETWSPLTADADNRSEVAWRVGRGTGTVVSPAGRAWQAALATGEAVQGDDAYVAAATLFVTLTGGDPAANAYAPPGIPADRAAKLAAVARETVTEEEGKVHYQAPYSGVVRIESPPDGTDLWFMDSGTSSEQIWFARMNDVLPKAGLVPHGTEIGYTNPAKAFDDAALAKAATPFAAHAYHVLFARQYMVAADAIRAAGGQPDLQVQVWDRHQDVDTNDGVTALETMESTLVAKYDEARALGLALVPYHLMFARLKTLRPSVQLLSDGVHATYPIGYGLAVMSVVSRTGACPPVDGLDDDTKAASQVACETVRQLSALSVSGDFVPDL